MGVQLRSGRCALGGSTFLFLSSRSECLSSHLAVEQKARETIPSRLHGWSFRAWGDQGRAGGGARGKVEGAAAAIQHPPTQPTALAASPHRCIRFGRRPCRSSPARPHCSSTPFRFSATAAASRSMSTAALQFTRLARQDASKIVPDELRGCGPGRRLK